MAGTACPARLCSPKHGIASVRGRWQGVRDTRLKRYEQEKRRVIVIRFTRSVVWICAVGLALLSWTGVAQGLGSGESGFGIQWVRSNPFVIMGHDPIYQNDPCGADLYWDTNHTFLATDSSAPLYSKVQGWTEPYGKPWIRYRPQTTWTPNWYGAHVVLDLTVPNLKGYMVKDEPSMSEMTALAAVVAGIRGITSEILVFVNMSGETANGFPGQYDHLQATINPDVLMYDQYPLRSSGLTHVEYFETLMKVRNRALFENKPYWAYLQSWSKNAEASDGWRVPSESDMYWNAYTHLTAGFTGLDYWTHNLSQNFDSALVNADGTPSAIYPFAQAINLEVQNLGRSLRFLTSTDVRFIPGEHGAGIKNDTPPGLSDWSSNAGGDANILDVSVSSDSEEENGLLGFFTDDDGQRYFMLTNLDHGMNQSAPSQSLSFSMVFDQSINELLRLNRITGEQEIVVLNNHVLNLTLLGGTGDLFKYNTGDFEFGPTILGTVDLEGYSGDTLDVMAKVEFRQGGSLVRTERIPLDALSQFTVVGVPLGTYEIAVYVHNYLQTVLTAVDVLADPTNLGVITLEAGDANGDNIIDLRDFSLLVSNWLLSGDL